jgi:hypothetical protein
MTGSASLRLQCSARRWPIASNTHDGQSTEHRLLANSKQCPSTPPKCWREASKWPLASNTHDGQSTEPPTTGQQQAMTITATGQMLARSQQWPLQSAGDGDSTAAGGSRQTAHRRRGSRGGHPCGGRAQVGAPHRPRPDPRAQPVHADTALLRGGPEGPHGAAAGARGGGPGVAYRLCGSAAARRVRAHRAGQSARAGGRRAAPVGIGASEPGPYRPSRIRTPAATASRATTTPRPPIEMMPNPRTPTTIR